MFVDRGDPPRPQPTFPFRARPYRGERPTVAGSLLYPDTPAQMETTSREAFGLQPGPRRDAGRGEQDSRGNGRGNGPRHAASGQPGRARRSRGESPPAADQEDDDARAPQAMADDGAGEERETWELQTLYQRDFPPPASRCRRRTPAHPQPDNIAINPALRIEFKTVQRETYPGWPIIKHRNHSRRREARTGRSNSTAK